MMGLLTVVLLAGALVGCFECMLLSYLSKALHWWYTRTCYSSACFRSLLAPFTYDSIINDGGLTVSSHLGRLNNRECQDRLP